MSGKPYNQKSESEFSILVREKFKKQLTLLAVCLSTHIPVSETILHKYAFLTNKKGIFPFFIKNLHHHGIHSLDIKQATSELFREGTFSIEYNKEVVDSGISELSSPFDDKKAVRTMDIISILPKVANHPGKIADELGLPLFEIQRQIQKLVIRHGSAVKELGEQTRNYFINSLKDNTNYHYTSLRWSGKEKEERKLTIQPIVNIDTHGTKIFICLPRILTKLKDANRVIGKYGYDVLKRKEELQDHVFFLSEIKNAFNDKRRWEKVKGELCFQVGRLSNLVNDDKETNELHFLFTNESYKTEEEIRVILDKNGKFSVNPRELENHHYILVGWIDERSNEPIIKVSGLICLESLPKWIPKFNVNNVN